MLVRNSTHRHVPNPKEILLPLLSASGVTYVNVYHVVICNSQNLTITECPSAK